MKHYLHLIRFWNSLMALFVCLAVYYVSSQKIPDLNSALLSLPVFLTTAAGNALNDYFDYELDRYVNRKKPIVSGRIKRETALYLSIALFAVSLAISLIKVKLFLINLGSIAMLVFYDKYSKKLSIFGNTIVSLLTALVIIYGLAISGIFYPLSLLAFSAFLINMAREIVKDVEDYAADKRFNGRTIPIIFGRENAASIAKLFAVLSIVPLTKIMDFNRLLVVFLVIAYSLTLFKNITKNATRIQKLYKVLMFVSILLVLK